MKPILYYLKNYHLNLIDLFSGHKNRVSKKAYDSFCLRKIIFKINIIPNLAFNFTSIITSGRSLSINKKNVDDDFSEGLGNTSNGCYL